MFTRFEPQPTAEECPRGFVDPRDGITPHPLAVRAAHHLQAALHEPSLASMFANAELVEPHAGKMFGVLVVRAPDATMGYLQAFSGMLGQQWFIDGFAPPVFDDAERSRSWDGGQLRLAELNAAHEALVRSEAYKRACEQWRAERENLRLAGDALREHHRANKHQRHIARKALLAQGRPVPPKADLDALERQSRADRRERRAFEQQSTSKLAALQTVIDGHEQEIKRIASVRSALSVDLTAQMQASYRFTNPLGEMRMLRELATSPPAGTGDCAAPKLLMQAFRLGLTPLALAEFWWGASSHNSNKISGNFYLPCRKCELILPFLLRGVDVLPPTSKPVVKAAAATLEILFEDAWLVAVNKPSGILSVPGRNGEDASGTPHQTCLQDLLQERYDGTVATTFPRVVHRLDMHTSGILLAAKDAATFAKMHRAFAARTVEKTYVALLDGVGGETAGTIDLPLGPDLDARPRQQRDEHLGKRALTNWRVIATEGEITRIAFFPQTGRTHQLRVHAAHPQGLGMPIVGDTLYGHAAERLMLHASTLAFVHPHTGEQISLTNNPPF